MPLERKPVYVCIFMNERGPLSCKYYIVKLPVMTALFQSNLQLFRINFLDNELI